MRYFTVSELTRSDTARRLGISNVADGDICRNLIALINNLLDPIREAYGRPIHVNSGFRSPALNAAVGGASTSQHQFGQAADITVGSPSENAKLFACIVALQDIGSIEFDQLIDEKNYAWVHISYRHGGPNRGQILRMP